MATESRKPDKGQANRDQGSHAGGGMGTSGSNGKSNRVERQAGTKGSKTEQAGGKTAKPRSTEQNDKNLHGNREGKSGTGSQTGGSNKESSASGSKNDINE